MPQNRKRNNKKQTQNLETENLNNIKKCLNVSGQIEELLSSIKEAQIQTITKINDFGQSVSAFYPDPKDKYKIYSTILEKLEGNTTNSQEFKASNLLKLAQSYMELSLIEPDFEISYQATALDKLNEALSIAHRLNLDIDLEKTIDNLIELPQDQKNAFSLAKQSLGYRCKKLLHIKNKNKGNSIDVFKEIENKLKNSKTLKNKEKALGLIHHALIKVAQVANSSKDTDLKIEALKYADTAYNLVSNQKDTTKIAESLEALSKLHEQLGNNKRADILKKEIENISYEVVDIENKNELFLGHTGEPSLIRINKIKDTSIFKIKSEVRDSILNPISEAASKGKWVDKQFTGNYGVSGYLENIEKDNIVLLSLCLEAINLGIASGRKKTDTNEIVNDPTCAIIFAENYPNIIENVLKSHPDFFVNKKLFMLAVNDANNHQNLIGKVDNISRDKYQEEAIKPFIKERLLENTIKPALSIIEGGSWNKSLENKLTNYLSEDYLTGISMFSTTSNLGNNLSSVPNAVEIARYLITKDTIDSIIVEGSSNYTPVESLLREYPNTAEKIHDNYFSYLKIQSPSIAGILNDVVRAQQSDNSKDSTDIFSQLNSSESLPDFNILQDQENSIENQFLMGNSVKMGQITYEQN